MALFPAKPHGWTKTVEIHVIYNFFYSFLFSNTYTH